MQSPYQASRLEIGCLTLLWLLSPLAALYVWLFTKAVLWIQSTASEYLKANMEGAPISLSQWINEWRPWWWLLLIGAVTIPFLLVAYFWVILSTGRILYGLWKRR